MMDFENLKKVDGFLGIWARAVWNQLVSSASCCEASNSLQQVQAGPHPLVTKRWGPSVSRNISLDILNCWEESY